MAVPPRAATGGNAPAVASPTVAAVPAPRSLPAPASAAGAVLTDTPASGVAGLAWIVREVTHVPGVLRLHDGRLSFESTRGVVFAGTAAELGLEVPRSSRSGLHVTVGGERLRLCVVRPAGAVPPCDDLVASAADGRPITSGGLDAWTVWRPLLAPERSADARPAERVRRALAFARHTPRDLPG